MDLRDIARQSAAEALWATVMKGEGIRHVPIEEWDENALREAVRGNKPVIFTPNPAVEWEIHTRHSTYFMRGRWTIPPNSHSYMLEKGPPTNICSIPHPPSSNPEIVMED
eukprot:1331366-Amorphochlora_amoeboformis.AAC.2